MRKFIPFVLLLILCACSVKLPLFEGNYTGITQTCTTGPNALWQPDVIEFKTEESNIALNKYMGCMTVPEHFNKIIKWPSSLWLRFKDSSYMFLYYDGFTSNEYGLGFNYPFDSGKFYTNKKHNIITLKSYNGKWGKNFKAVYSKNSNILTLTVKH